MITSFVVFLRKHRVSTSLFLSLIMAFSIVIIITKPFSTSVLDLLPLKDRIISKHYTFLSLSGAMDQVVFDVYSNEENTNFEELKSATNWIADTLKKSDLIKLSLDIAPNDFITLRNTIIKNWPNLFTPQDSVWVIKRLNKDSLSIALNEKLQSLFGFSDGTTDEYILKNDPFGLAQYSLKKMSAFRPTENVTITDGYITNIKKTKILLTGKMTKSGMNNNSAESFVNLMDYIKTKLKKKNISVTWMGAVRASYDNAKTIQKDINLTAPLTAVLILIICLLVYSRFYYGLLAFIPTILGVLFTLALFLFFKKLSVIILGFGAALLGITIDYAIHYLFHIDAFPNDKTPENTIAPPILISALTTSGAFAVLIITGIPGLSLLGSVTAVGIIIVAFFSVIILPVFIKPTITKSTRTPLIKPHKFFAKYYTTKLNLYISVLVCTMGILGWALSNKISFDGNPSHMNGMKQTTINAEKKIQKDWPGLTDGAFLVVSDTSLEGTLKKAEQNLVPLADSLYKANIIGKVEVITSLLPSTTVQKVNNKRWSKVFTKNISSLLYSVIDSVSQKYEIDPKAFYNYVSFVNSYSNKSINLDSTNSFINQNMFSTKIKKALINHYLFESDGKWFLNVPVFINNGFTWNEVSQLANKYNVLAVNDAVLGSRVVEIIKTGFLRCVFYIPLVVFLVLLLTLKNIKFTIIAFIPSIIAGGITVGIMSFFSIKITIISLMIFAFIFGLGIDYSLLLVHMSRLTLKDGIERIPHATASISVASATTLAGLGVMAFAHHPVLYMIGISGLIGILSSYICAVTIIPLFVSIFTNKNN